MSVDFHDISDAMNQLGRPAALHVGARSVGWIAPDGQESVLSLRDAAIRLRQEPPVLLCHGAATAKRLGIAPFPALDVLELFAFVHPASFCVPSPAGLAQALGLKVDDDPSAGARSLYPIARRLLENQARRGEADRQALPLAWAMARGNWPWAGYLLRVLSSDGEMPHSRNVMHSLRVWQRLREWSDVTPPPPSDQLPVQAQDARQRLAELLGGEAESRPSQQDYAARVAAAFHPRDREGEPNVVLAEAGTGIGKTLGYIAPASLWAERNGAPVWISTYTRNLQRQVDGELDRLYDDPVEKSRRVVVRKGRENYLCLLNMEEAVGQVATRPDILPALGLMIRWTEATRDGDMVGGDFPGWLAGLLGRRWTVELSDTRGECVYSSCPHYGRCFVERSIRRARRAHVIIANHALVMVQAALGGDESAPLSRLVFDEGHHLFDAADSAFSARLSGLETADLRRWLRGAEEGSRSRARGLKERIGDLLTNDKGQEALAMLLGEATRLPGPGWHQRIAGGEPRGPAEHFLARVRQQVMARANDPNSGYGIEAPLRPPVPGLEAAAADLETALEDMLAPLRLVISQLAALLDDQADELETQVRLRIESTLRGLERRGLMPVQAWRDMLRDLRHDPPEQVVDWLEIERRDGQDVDMGLNRHWIDPTVPLAREVVMPAHGVLITSATLRDEQSQEDWDLAAARTGARHLIRPAVCHHMESPFDYPRQSRVYVIGDVNKNDLDQVAAAYRELFLAAGGGGLGIFTAISRLRAVHGRISGPLEQAGLTLHAQHVDGMDTGSLIDIFRAEESACLLGTDAVRDGVDVPGRSLRLIVFERVPWPRPTLLHKARRQAFCADYPDESGRRYDEMLTRLKLKQAYGRLLRRAEDKGVFVMLERSLPSRLASAFPDGVDLRRVGLAEAVAACRDFLAAPE